MTAGAGTVVLKIGGSVLVGDRGWSDAVACVRRERATGSEVLVVVSATNGTTETLLEQARGRSSAPSERLLARLLRSGEETSAALLGMALEEAGIANEVRDAAWLDLAVHGSRLDAEPIGVDSASLRAAIGLAGVLVVPGFVGRHVDGGPALLGRGGSDLTAVFLAGRLGAPCRLIKDVDGLYVSDPRAPGPPPDRYVRATWRTVLERGDDLVQSKAVRAAETAGVRLTVVGTGGLGTAIGSEPDVLDRLEAAS
jgi:homoserine dehydrogenase